MLEHSSFKPVLDGLTTAVIALDDRLHIHYINASAEAMLGISASQILGKPVSHCFSETDGTPSSLREALRENSHFTKRKARWRLHNFSEITVDYSVTPNPDLGSLIIEVQPLDRMLRISREEALLSSQETSRNLVRSLAHEIKNPLGGIRGAAQLLSRELQSRDLEEYTNIIVDETDRLRNLVDRMLGPCQPLQRQPVNIHEVVEHVATVIKAEAAGTVDLVRDYDPSIPELPGDKSQLIQAVLNIARNALQALQENPAQQSPIITFATRVQRRFTIGRTHHPLVARVDVIDNGPGIAPELLEDIFFPMITGRADGTGLGLAISQNLVNQHRGLIECQSEPGKTAFSIYLPLDDDHAEV
jgi:two-component system nitrogen regulation sensor histidine kinase GlnL